MNFKRTMEIELEEQRKQQAHIHRIRDLNSHLYSIYGGMIVADYHLRELGPIEVITFIDESAVAHQPLEQRLSMPTTFIYGILRNDQPEYIITLFHPKYINPIHLFVNEEKRITRVSSYRDDVRNLGTFNYDHLADFFKDYPLDFVQENELFILGLQELRKLRGF